MRISQGLGPLSPGLPESMLLLHPVHTRQDPVPPGEARHPRLLLGGGAVRTVGEAHARFRGVRILQEGARRVPLPSRGALHPRRPKQARVQHHRFPPSPRGVPAEGSRHVRHGLGGGIERAAVGHTREIPTVPVPEPQDPHRRPAAVRGLVLPRHRHAERGGERGHRREHHDARGQSPEIAHGGEQEGSDVQVPRRGITGTGVQTSGAGVHAQSGAQDGSVRFGCGSFPRRLLGDGSEYFGKG